MDRPRPGVYICGTEDQRNNTGKAFEIDCFPRATVSLAKREDDSNLEADNLADDERNGQGLEHFSFKHCRRLTYSAKI